VLAVVLLASHNVAHAAIGAAAPLDQSAVSPIVALDNAVEAVAARVTPAVVSVSVASKPNTKVVVEDREEEGGPDGPEGPGAPAAPGAPAPGGQQRQYRYYFFGPNGPMSGMPGMPDMPDMPDMPQMPGMQSQPQQVERGVGSGVIVSPDGYIVTNNHVVDGANEIRVTLNDRRVFPAKLVGRDELNDLAVIKIDAKDLTSIAWGDSTKIKPGQTVLAFGSPFGYFQFSVTRGIVSAVDRPNPYSDDARKPGDFIQTDAAINPGNSGGPLVNAYGELIGIDTFIISNSGSFAGAGFAIPSQIVRSSTEAIIKDGTVHHGFLGISMNDVTPENASFFELPDATGAIVSQVTPDSPASKAGIQQGDVLRELNGKKIVNGSAVQVAISQTAPGTPVEIGILRGGKAQTLKVTVGEMKSVTTTVTMKRSDSENKGKLGLSVTSVNDETRRQFRIPENVKGAVIQQVRPGSPADDAGLAAGNVVEEVNRKPVEDAESFVNQVKAAPEGKDILLLVWARGGASYRVVHTAPEPNGNKL
jgi:serine protease Do